MHNTNLVLAMMLTSFTMMSCGNDDSQQKATCGNGILEQGEFCDTTQFSPGKDICPSGTTGIVTCSDSCIPDANGCNPVPPEEDPCSKKPNHCSNGEFFQCNSLNGEVIHIPCEGETPDCDDAAGCYKREETTEPCKDFVNHCTNNKYISCDAETGDEIITPCEGETPDCDDAIGCYKREETVELCKNFVNRCTDNKYISCDAKTGDEIITPCEGETPDCDETKGCIANTDAVKCPSGAYYCDNNVFVTCDEATGKETRTTCEGDRPFCHAAAPENGIAHGCEYIQPEDGAHGLPDIKTTNYVTPEDFGAKGDGKTDDYQAFQDAIDSGKNVLCTDPTKTYLIRNDVQLVVNNKKDFQMNGCRIHRPCNDSDKYLYLFWLNNTSNSVFENMSVSTTTTCSDTRIPSGHRRPNPNGSNLLVFSGYGNKNISFINNAFENADADYWFNASSNERGWKNTLIDGWKSDSTSMPLFGQYIQSLTVHNANVKPSPDFAGDGDHCMYVSLGSSDVLVKNSYFSYDGSYAPLVLLTFHKQTDDPGMLQPKNNRVVDSKIEAKNGRALYCGLYASVSVDHCDLSSTSNRTDIALISSQNDVKNTRLGSGTWHIKNSTLTTPGSAAAMNKEVVFENSTITAAQVAESHAFPGQQSLNASHTDINLGKGSLFYSASGVELDHSYTACNIAKSEKYSYVISKRTKDGSVLFDNCSIDGGGSTYFIYNGGKVDFSGLSLKDTKIKNVGAFGNASEAKNYSAVNSTVNGNAI